MCALQMLVNLETGGDILVDTISEVLQEQSRLNIPNELRRFTEDNRGEDWRSGEKLGGDQSGQAQVQEGTLRTFINTREREEWENLYYKFVEMNKEVNVRNPSGSSRGKTLWK